MGKTKNSCPPGRQKNSGTKKDPEVSFLDSGRVIFYHSATGKLGLKMKNVEREGIEELVCGDVQPVSLFPFTKPAQFVSLRNNTGEEIGIIRKLKDLSGEARNLLKKELTRNYLTPVIMDIVQIKESFGNYCWRVITDRGEKEFYTKGRSENIVFINDWQAVVTDIEKCRYEIKDFRKLPRRARTKLGKVI